MNEWMNELIIKTLSRLTYYKSAGDYVFKRGNAYVLYL